MEAPGVVLAPVSYRYAYALDLQRCQQALRLVPSLVGSVYRIIEGDGDVAIRVLVHCSFPVLGAKLCNSAGHGSHECQRVKEYGRKTLAKLNVTRIVASRVARVGQTAAILCSMGCEVGDVLLREFKGHEVFRSSYFEDQQDCQCTRCDDLHVG